MYIQKRGASFYLKSSTFDERQKRPVGTSQYLGKSVDAALEQLEKLVQHQDFLTLRDGLLAVSVKPVDIMQEIKKHIRKAHELSAQIDDEELKVILTDLMVKLK